jgi:hypothetical protein
MEKALKDIILKAVEHDFLMEIEDKTLGFLNKMPTKMIDHLKSCRRSLDFANTKKLLGK